MEERIDKRVHHVLVLDTETANTLQNEKGLDMSNVLAYDCGWAIIDTHGKVYKTRSLVNADIYIGEKDLMASAYYADKLPQYQRDLNNGTRKMATTKTIRRIMLEDIKKYNIHHVCAHNAYFDMNALNSTLRWATKSQSRYWFPYESVTWWDTMKMAKSIIAPMPSYQGFCRENGYLTSTGKVRVTAEILWRFISKDYKFQESHTGLEDVMIEKEILAYCFRKNKSMEKELFSKKPLDK